MENGDSAARLHREVAYVRQEEDNVVHGVREACLDREQGAAPEGNI